MESVHEFQETVWEYFRRHGRQLPWRPPSLKLGKDGTLDPYAVLVSEVMLQQTQANRVVPKFQEFLRLFPTIQALTDASLAQVLTAWSGLGYNRRAKYLYQTAQALAAKSRPWAHDDLIACPGIGANTAGAILVYAYNQSEVFIETNVRTVYIHHFFANQASVSDQEILKLVRLTLPSREEQPDEAIHSLPGAMRSPARGDSRWGRARNPEGMSHYREWYWALMDYGTYLKSTVGNLSQASKIYTKQSTFQGSSRQLRGQVIRLLTTQKYSAIELTRLVPDERLPAVLETLAHEGLIRKRRGGYSL